MRNYSKPTYPDNLRTIAPLFDSIKITPLAPDSLNLIENISSKSILLKSWYGIAAWLNYFNYIWDLFYSYFSLSSLYYCIAFKCIFLSLCIFYFI